MLQKDPLAPDAPQLQQRIVQAYTGDRLMAESFAESEKLATLYQPGTAWYEKNKDDPDALAQANAPLRADRTFAFYTGQEEPA